MSSRGPGRLILAVFHGFWFLGRNGTKVPYQKQQIVLCSIISDSWRCCGLLRTGLFCPWDFPGENTGLSCLFILQGIFPTQRLNSCFLSLLHWQVDTLLLSHLVKRLHLHFADVTGLFLQTQFYWNTFTTICSHVFTAVFKVQFQN